MNTKLSVLFAFVFGTSMIFSNECDNFYAQVSYGLSHSKKSWKAKNFEYQKYYAKRALDALQNSKKFMQECSCEESENKILEAIEILKEASGTTNWDSGKYFSKKSVAIVDELVTIIDKCTTNVPSTTTVVVEDNDNNEDSTIENESYAKVKEDMESSMEIQMIAIFNKYAKDRLKATEKAIRQMVLLTESFNYSNMEKEDNPNRLGYHQKTYLMKAKELLEKGLRSIDDKKEMGME